MILVLNAGSSSVKLALFRSDGAGVGELLARGQIEDIGDRPRMKMLDGAGAPLVDRAVEPSDAPDARAALGVVTRWLGDRFDTRGLAAVGHRVVHGGPRHDRPVLVDDAALAEIRALVPLAPLHQPYNVAGIEAVRERFPRLPQVACFDTAFHRGHPLLSDLTGLPWELYEAGVRRYGFHGLSYEYVASRFPELAPEIANGRVVAAHLGSGASLCALSRGRSVDSTMSFTALDGLLMGTRPGGLDPGAVLYLFRERGMNADQVEELLYRKSGLLGVSGVSNDMRDLLASEDPRARLAVDLFVHRAAKEIGALAAVLGGLDALVFTAGIGENSAVVRRRIAGACGWLGLKLDHGANERGGPCISASESRVSAWVIPTNEELMIARHTARLVAARTSSRSIA